MSPQGKDVLGSVEGITRYWRGDKAMNQVADREMGSIPNTIGEGGSLEECITH